MPHTPLTSEQKNELEVLVGEIVGLVNEIKIPGLRSLALGYIKTFARSRFIVSLAADYPIFNSIVTLGSIGFAFFTSFIHLSLLMKDPESNNRHLIDSCPSSRSFDQTLKLLKSRKESLEELRQFYIDFDKAATISHMQIVRSEHTDICVGLVRSAHNG